MRKRRRERGRGPVLWVAAAIVLAGASCGGPSRRGVTFSARPTQSDPASKLRTVRYDDPSDPIPIASLGRAQAHQLVRFFTQTNPHIDIPTLFHMARTYIEEARTEGINSDIAFCQMTIETNYLRFGKDVHPSQNNFGGIGATGGGNPGASFPSAEVGIRAHIQHLKAYADSRPLRNDLVDPRFGMVRRASGPHVDDLTSQCATDPLYGAKIRRKLIELEKVLQTLK